MSYLPQPSMKMRLALGVLVVALLTAACSDSAEPTTTSTPAAPATPTTSAPAGTSATTAPPATGATTPTSVASTATSGAAPTTTAAGQATTTTAPVTTTTSDPGLDAQLALRMSPLTVVTADGTEVTFSEWFFATFNRDTTVTVVRDGVVLAEGVVSDPEVMEDRGADGFFLFGPDGSQVAVVTQAELAEAANQALLDADLSP